MNNPNQISSTRAVAFYRGYDDMANNLNDMAFEAARDKFNADNPIGIRYATPEATAYAHGAVEALLDNLNKRIPA